ncbi:hypothetical protein Tco_0323600 [Tanacetum coccineum]
MILTYTVCNKPSLEAAIKFEGPLASYKLEKFYLIYGSHTRRVDESLDSIQYWAESARQIPDKGDLSAYWRGISSEGDFLGTAPSYTTIRDLMLRKFGSSTSFYLLARLLTEERLKGLTVMVQDLPVIDMTKLVRLQICEELDDTWAWVSPGQERQPDADGWMARLEDKYMDARALGLAREVLDSMASDFSDSLHWTRRVRRRTSEASTSAAPLDEDQPDP